MLTHEDAAALAEARHNDSFAVLEMHECDGALWVRAVLPGAVRVTVIDAQTGCAAASLVALHAGGVFEGLIPRHKQRFSYRLAVDYGDSTIEIEDPYRFAPVLGDIDVWLLAEGTHLHAYEVLGAHARESLGVSGYAFAVWAPNARRVAVVGDFNAWDGRRHPLRRRRECGVWEIFLPGIKPGTRYKYEIHDARGTLLSLMADPFAFATELRPATASLVPASTAPTAEITRPRTATDAPLSIYEVHAGSWRRHAEGSMPSWSELADQLLPYVHDLGFTHVEFLPVMEHPFDGSWGYQPTALYAPTARHGAPAEFGDLVRGHSLSVNLPPLACVMFAWQPT